jgi:hypothetical protein
MTMTDQEIQIINMLKQYGSTKRFQLKANKIIESAKPAARLWKFTFTNGHYDRIVPLFEDALITDSIDGALSEETRRKIDAELA